MATIELKDNEQACNRCGDVFIVIAPAKDEDGQPLVGLEDWPEVDPADPLCGVCRVPAPSHGCGDVTCCGDTNCGDCAGRCVTLRMERRLRLVGAA